ncbi:hypothetical protein LEP1GSC188_3659 [Leptospira weilii serovar Topaz str. LT2116]|uniref:Uncharacterized protein n=1 Tax=Leptospira weilii serovar Topaz str. LT2116 TaxID=1088540 RepID=M3GV78_9LEPT|nr:hypothetical protein LEP1GSC188_3659 [Leptospira weilii serovar Topaz str. LT2116]
MSEFRQIYLKIQALVGKGYELESNTLVRARLASYFIYEIRELKFFSNHFLAGITKILNKYKE